MNEARVAPPQHVAGVARPPVAPVATPPVAELPVARTGARHHHGEPPVQLAQVAYLVELGASGQTSRGRMSHAPLADSCRCATSQRLHGSDE